LADLQRIQRLRKFVLALGATTYFALATVSTTIPLLPETVHEALEAVGVILIALAVGGRAWCTLYIGGRKKVALVQSGPYSVMRNPLYSFTFLGVLGIGLQFGGLSFALIGLVIAWSVFTFVVQQEERFLEERYHAEYKAYLERVPRFLPKFSEWSDLDVLEVQPRLVLRTVLDASLMLLALPYFEIVEYLQQIGFLSVLLILY